MNCHTLDDLRDACKNCLLCDLSKGRTNVVFGQGNPNADVMFIGEGPGEQEDITGLPFVGRAGKLLDKYLFAMGMERDKIYIANMVKCRPPQNRDPSPGEQDICIGYLREQVRLINPKIIVCLGRISAQRLIDPDFKVTKQHGEWIIKNGIYMMGTYHPASLLRNPAQKPQALEDFIKIRDKAQELAE